ncbi:MAG: toll/interleukin-1 receptor domain-containing protein [Rhodopila sp.]
METARRIFISYARSDGRAFAEAFEARLAAEGLHSWRDIKDMGAGDILPQVERAIDRASDWQILQTIDLKG